MATNMNKLRGKIKEMGFTQEELARRINLDPSTLSRKMSTAGIAFSIGEMHAIVEALELSKEEAIQIFLA